MNRGHKKTKIPTIVAKFNEKASSVLPVEQRDLLQAITLDVLKTRKTSVQDVLDYVQSLPEAEVDTFAVLQFAQRKLEKWKPSNQDYNKKPALLELVQFAHDRANNDANPDYVRLKADRLLARYKVEDPDAVPQPAGL